MFELGDNQSKKFKQTSTIVSIESGQKLDG
jgi:hypothetical protein